MKIPEVNKIFTHAGSLITSNNYIIPIAIFLIIVVCVVMYYNKKTSNFANTGSGTRDKLNLLDIIMFTSSDCEYCPQQINALREQNVLDTIVIKNVSNDKEVEKEAKKYGVIGFPFFISLKNRTSTVGYYEDVDAIIEDLQPIQPAQDSKIYLLTRSGCGWCTKAKEDIASKNISKDIVSVLEASSPEAKEVIKKFNLKVEGVPVYVSGKNGDTVVGFKPIEDVKKKFGL